LGNRRGLSPRHVDQRLVGEHHIGRDPLLLGELRAPPPQRFEQGRIAVLAAGPEFSEAEYGAKALLRGCEVGQLLGFRLAVPSLFEFAGRTRETIGWSTVRY